MHDGKSIAQRCAAGRTKVTGYPAVAAGGALGAAARFGLVQLSGSHSDSFPWMTLVINVSGSLLLGFVFSTVVSRSVKNRRLRIFVVNGFIASFTTFSTFAVEADRLASAGHVVVSVTYVISSVLLGCLAVWLGVLGGRLVATSRGYGAELALGDFRNGSS